MKYALGVTIAILLMLSTATAQQRTVEEINLEKYSSLNAAITDIGSNQQTITVPNMQAVSSSLTIPANVALQVTGVGKFNLGSGVTLTINGPFDAPLRQVFTGSGVVKFGANVGTAYPQWFGGAMNNSADDAIAIQKAIDAFSVTGSFQSAGVVEITGGAAIGSTVTILNNAVTLRGQGWGSSINGQLRSFLRWIGSAGSPMILINNTWGAGIENLHLTGKSTAKPSAAIEIRDYSGAGANHAQDNAFLKRINIGPMGGYDIDNARQFATGILLSGSVNGDSNLFEQIIIDRCDRAIDIDNPNASYTQMNTIIISNCNEGIRTRADVDITNLLFGLVGTELIFDYGNAYVQITGYGSEGSGRLAKFNAPLCSLIIHGGSWQVGSNFTPADAGSDRWVIDGEGLTSPTIILENFDFIAFNPGANHVIRLGNSGGSHSTVLRAIDVTGLTESNIKVLPDPLTFTNAGAVIELVTRNTSGVMPPEHSRVLLDANRAEDRSFQLLRNDFAGKLNIFGGPLKVKKLIKPAVATATPTGSGATAYSYRVTALTYDGETDASPAATCTNASRLTPAVYNTVTWNQCQGAYAYKIYGRSSGAEQLLATVPLATLAVKGGYPQWVDNGSLTPSGALPATNTTGNLSVEGGLIVGGGSSIIQVLSATAPLDFKSTAAQTNNDLTITVTGATPGDVVNLGVPHNSVVANSSYTAWVSAPNQVTVRLNNYGSTAIDPPSGTFRAQVTKF